MRGLLRGFRERRVARDLQRELDAINALGSELESASETAIDDRIARIRRGPFERAEAFALVREVAHRTIGLRPFDVQMIAGIHLDDGHITQMDTGEGKTLAAVAPVWLNSLAGRGVHVLTFNDYLAERDAKWMGPIYERLGVTVAFIHQHMSPQERRTAYAADVTYATVKEAGFDYLRDEIVTDPADRVHRPLHFVLVDEADSLMIDEARVPLVIAGGKPHSRFNPQTITRIASQLEPDIDFEVDENARTVYLTDGGVTHAEALLNAPLYDEGDRGQLLSALNLALQARVLLQRDVDYIVRDDHIFVVDEFTGRVIDDRRWPHGLQPALEAKEGVTVRAEGDILGMVPIQHFLRQYPKLAGMTATAATSAGELEALYGKEVRVVAPNRPCIRKDEPDEVFVSREQKYARVIQEVQRANGAGRPVLVGTASVRESEHLAQLLEDAGTSCKVLNAKHDAEEAGIIADAGRVGAVTISTNMAGRGTDIKLGGADESQRDEVVALGGLYVIATNKHEARRIDNQLRGRAGRQGDPGTSRFFVSLEDDLVERYGLEHMIRPLMDGGAGSDEITREIERAQRIVEGQNLDIRTTLARYAALIESNVRSSRPSARRLSSTPRSSTAFARAHRSDAHKWWSSTARTWL